MRKITEKIKKIFRHNDHRRTIAISVLLIAAAAGICVVCVQNYREKSAKDVLKQLAESTESIQRSSLTEASAKPLEVPAESAASEVPAAEQANDGTQVLREMKIPVPEKEVDFAELQDNTNEDIYAWIYIPDTQINYPMLQHPSDNTYYLDHNLDGSKGYPGCIYTEDFNTRDFTDSNTVIYGHNMKDGSMFAGLHKYSDMDYMKEHPYIYIYTEDYLYVYEIFAACEYSNEHILYSYDFSDKAGFEKYLEDICAAGEKSGSRKENVEVSAEDRIVTLSTCIANQPDKRYLVQGVLLNGK